MGLKHRILHWCKKDVYVRPQPSFVLCYVHKWKAFILTCCRRKLKSLKINYHINWSRPHTMNYFIEKVDVHVESILFCFSRWRPCMYYLTEFKKSLVSRWQLNMPVSWSALHNIIFYQFAVAHCYDTAVSSYITAL